MKSVHTEEEFIASIALEELSHLRQFLESFDLRAENAEVLDHFAGDTLRKKFGEDVHAIETNNGEKFIVVFGKDKVHVLLKKNANFEQLSQKFFQYLSF